MPEYVVRSQGAKQVAVKFTRMGEAAVAARPAMEAVAILMMKALGMTFESQGRRGGGSWKRDTPEWLTRKLRNHLDPRIGHATLALRNSVSIPGAPHQDLLVTDTLVHLSSDLPYARTEQRHRPFVKFTIYDRMRMRDIIRDHLMTAFHAA